MSWLGRILCLSVLLFTNIAYAEDEVYDPWESYNRAVFDFNNTMDEYVAEPVARGYDYILPGFVKKGISNFFKNISYPKYLLSDLIQLKFTQAAKHTGRFLVNSTIGVAGFIDVAEDMGLEHHYEDIGVALAYQGVPAGPYFMVPFLGPTTVRDGIGQIVEFFITPWYWFDEYSHLSWEWNWGITSGVTVLNLIDTRYNMLEAIQAAKESSVDYYLFAQSAYYQYRNGLVKDVYKPKEELDAAAEDDWLLEGEDDESATENEEDEDSSTKEEKDEESATKDGVTDE